MQIIKDRELAQTPWVYHSVLTNEDECANTSTTSLADTSQTLTAYTDWLELSIDERTKIGGIYLLPEDSLSIKAHELASLSVIGIVFPNFNEGRGYTQAAILRNQLHYSEELRAINAYRDNLVLLEDCGFNAFEMTQSEDIQEALTAFDELTLSNH